MNFREYKIGSRMFALALGGSMCITLLLPSLDIASVDATSISMDKQLTAGYETGFNIYDPLLLGNHKPMKVLLKADPASGTPSRSTLMSTKRALRFRAASCTRITSARTPRSSASVWAKSAKHEIKRARSL